MKSLLLLWQVTLSEEGVRCCTSTTLDYKAVERRCEGEGLSYLTIGLPQFGKDLERALSQELVSPDLFIGYAKKGKLPVFLGGFMDLIFSRKDGSLFENPSIDAIRAIRQLTLMFAKISLECTIARTEAAMKGFIECEKQVRDCDVRMTPEQYTEFRRISRLLWAESFSNVDEHVYYGRILPKHGPGSTADGLKGNLKYVQHEWPCRLDEVFSHEDYLIPHYRYLNDIAGVDLLEPGAERPVRVIAVPKTQKTPRIIAIEPTCMQYMQQGLMERLVESIECHDKHSWIIGFEDQRPNQLLAQEGSFYRNLATLDLSEASDRVSYRLVAEMFRNHPHLWRAVDATRSRTADVPGFGIQSLAKFASMGSALCFPIEALVFSTLIFMGIQDALNEPLTYKMINSFKGKVRVYGDDMIVPVEFVPFVVSKLEAFGFKVNASKSFWDGSFRESCGKDYFRGEDVTVVRVREFLPTQRHDVKEIVSTVSLRNQLYRAGLWSTVGYLDRLLGGVMKHFPAVDERSPVLGRHTFLPLTGERMSPTLHKPLVKGYVVKVRAPESNLEGYGALLKFFLKRGKEPFADRNHLTRYGRAEIVNIKLGWHSAL